jgi:hypothetical protein
VRLRLEAVRLSVLFLIRRRVVGCRNLDGMTLDRVRQRQPYAYGLVGREEGLGWVVLWGRSRRKLRVG